MFISISVMDAGELVKRINAVENVKSVTAYAQGYHHYAIVEVEEPKAKRGPKPKETENTNAPESAEGND